MTTIRKTGGINNPQVQPTYRETGLKLISPKPTPVRGAPETKPSKIRPQGPTVGGKKAPSSSISL